MRQQRHGITTARGTEHVVARAVVRWLGAACAVQSLGHLALTGCVWAWLPPGVPGARAMLIASAAFGVVGALVAALAVSWSL